MFIVSVDLGQAVDYTAIAVVERIEGAAPAPSARPEASYHLRHLHRPPLGTKYPAIVEGVLGLLDRAPLTRRTPLVVDKTGVGAAVVDLFAAAGVRPRAITITGGADVNREDPHDLKVPKRELASTLVALVQTGRFKMAEGLDLAPALMDELVNFKVKLSPEGHDSYEAWRESTHDDLVLCVAMGCWYGEAYPPPAPPAAPREVVERSTWRGFTADQVHDPDAADGRELDDGPHAGRGFTPRPGPRVGPSRKRW